MKQTVRTIGLIHALANNKHKMHFESGSTLKNPRGVCVIEPWRKSLIWYLEKYDAIRVIHRTTAPKGQTETPSRGEKVSLYFIALVHVNGHLYVLDAQKPFPMNHAETSDEMLEITIEICKKLMEYELDKLRFDVSTLSAASFVNNRNTKYHIICNKNSISPILPYTNPQILIFSLTWLI